MQILLVLYKTNSLKNSCQENRIFEHIFLSRAFIPKISNTTTITRIGRCPVHESVVNNVSYFFFRPSQYRFQMRTDQRLCNSKNSPLACLRSRNKMALKGALNVSNQKDQGKKKRLLLLIVLLHKIG